jgi:hypothetical protein
MYIVKVGDDSGIGDAGHDAISDAQGYFVLPKIRGTEATEKIEVKAEKSGYAFKSGGEVRKNGDTWTLSDLIFTPMNKALEGQTTPGARVVAAALETSADATGHFRFEGLPAGVTNVYAAKDGQFGQATLSPNTPLQIDLKPLGTQKVDAEMGRQIWRETLQATAGKDYFAADWIRWKLKDEKPDDLENLRREALVPPTPDHDDSLSYLIVQSAPFLQKTNQLSALDEVLPGISIREIRLKALLGAALATDDKPLMQRAMNEAQQVLVTRPPDTAWREDNLYDIAVLTEKLNGTQEGIKTLDVAINWTLGHHPEKAYRKDGRAMEEIRDEVLVNQAANVARGSVEMLRHLLTFISPEESRNLEALSRAIPVVAKTHGLQIARPLLEEISKMPRPTTEENVTRYRDSPQWYFNAAARELVPLLGKESPQRALELAHRITDGPFKDRALLSAAKFQSEAVANQLYSELVQKGDLSNAPRYAALAWATDKKLGVELFEIARQRIAVTMNDRWVRGNAWPFFTFYYARVDAAASRLILEREWAKSQQTNSGSMEGIAMAMTAIAGKRADEMARQIPEGDPDMFQDTRRKIGVYLIANEEARRDFPFDRWGASDTWEPGDDW